jgi:hypothetical protein
LLWEQTPLMSPLVEADDEGVEEKKVSSLLEDN